MLEGGGGGGAGAEVAGGRGAAPEPGRRETGAAGRPAGAPHSRAARRQPERPPLPGSGHLRAVQAALPQYTRGGLDSDTGPPSEIGLKRVIKIIVMVVVLSPPSEIGLIRVITIIIMIVVLMMMNKKKTIKNGLGAIAPCLMCNFILRVNDIRV